MPLINVSLPRGTSSARTIRSGAYVVRQDTSIENAHAHGTGPPLVMARDSGSGKSALLANWENAFADEGSHWTVEHPLVLAHFVGAK